MSKNNKGIKQAIVHSIRNGERLKQHDNIIAESPLQIILVHGPALNRQKELLSVTMRTPGEDFNLVTGFLFCEGIIQQATDILSARFVGNPGDEDLQENTIEVSLAPHVLFNAVERKRNFIASSACGFCGKTTDDLVKQKAVFKPVGTGFQINASVIGALPALLQSSQGLFSNTGGAHAVALVNNTGQILQVAEDVGRHNAMDKLAGYLLKQQMLPLHNNLLLFSGRLSYELVQKSLMAGAPMLCSIGAPTSLAIELAGDYGLTVIGFVKNNSFNIYCGAEKIIGS
ncbi:formate dehydrogenase accessory sulfurtransferase FdhD [Foetidibacter luteolus]|uniref:formate dehydrogenase accessory sulfurtransferase FdhD n=1 Tax=Foetidibacter luteolus TaxID=2608880 RepID=UPI00129A4331|nr:formate dehydrogenase accessory sulfurtransferase FdhD [Foetidibacter luteolus]